LGFVELLLIAVGLSMDAFAVSVTNGLVYKENYHKNFKNIFLTGLTFGVFQGAMPLLGYYLGISFFEYITKFDHWIAFILLGFIGGKMISEAMLSGKEFKKNSNKADNSKENSAAKSSKLTTKLLLMQGVATSIDALAVGISFSALNIDNVFIPCGLIAVVTLIMGIAGVYIGRKFGDLLNQKAMFFGGVVLAAIGLKILIEHLIKGV
jgi:putative Mn2+ efflux pump MntP